jgi:hypothetical protein
MPEKIFEIDIGDSVVCDFCNADYTNSDKEGGFVIDGYGVCPDCAPDHLKTVKECNEENHISHRCPAGVSFKRFILAVRDGDNTIGISVE